MNSNNIGIVVVVILDGSKYNSHRSAFLVGAGKLENVGMERQIYEENIFG